MRGTEATLCCSSAFDYEEATEQAHATDLVQAHLIETLSCIGRDYWDFYFLRVRRTVPEFVISGVLEALEMARQEGHIRHIGLHSVGDANPTIGLWRLHDAFEAILIERDPDPLVALARERRVGVVSPLPIEGATRLLSVTNRAEIPCA